MLPAEEIRCIKSRVSHKLSFVTTSRADVHITVTDVMVIM